MALDLIIALHAWRPASMEGVEFLYDLRMPKSLK